MYSKKFMIIGIFAMSVTLSSFGQKCVKFIDYQNKTINTKGLNMQIMGQPVGVGATEVVPIQRAVSDRLQELDLLQSVMCQQLNNAKKGAIRDQLQMQYTNLLMDMMSLLKNEGETESETANLSQKGNEQQNSNGQQSKKEKKSSDNVTPTPNNDPTPKPVPNNDTKPKPKSNKIKVDLPCKQCVIDAPDGVIRGSGSETSMDAGVAKKAARTAALEDLATQVEVAVSSVTQDYLLRTKKGASGKGMSEEVEKTLESGIEASVKTTLVGCKTICEEMFFDEDENEYTCYIALEISKDNVLKSVFNEVKQNAEVKEAIPEYDKFKQNFNKMMGTLKENY